MKSYSDNHVSVGDFEKISATAQAALAEVQELKTMYRFLSKVTFISTLISLASTGITIYVLNIVTQ